MVPKGDYKILDDWDVMGLRGTGSNSVVIEDKFVPDHRIVSHKDVRRDLAGPKLHAEPVYRAPIWSFVPFTISAPACGVAQGHSMLSSMRMKVRGTTRSRISPLAKKPGMHVRIAEASAR
jgi:3-hydroxy-9,10-secoandrosta-1,3,5(10)-triene-9,17-dione monooxygenase